MSEKKDDDNNDNPNAPNSSTTLKKQPLTLIDLIYDLSLQHKWLAKSVINLVKDLKEEAKIPKIDPMELDHLRKVNSELRAENEEIKVQLSKFVKQ